MCTVRRSLCSIAMGGGHIRSVQKATISKREDSTENYSLLF